MPAQSIRFRRDTAGAAAPPLPSTASVAGQLLTGHVVVLAASLVVNVVSARVLGPAGRGELALLLQLGYVLQIFGVAGSDRAYPALAHPTPGLPAAARDLGRLVAPSLLALVGACLLAGAALSVGGPVPPGYGPGLAALVLAGVLLVTLRTASVAAGTAGFYLRLNVASQLVLVAGTLTLMALEVATPLTWLAVYAAATGAPALYGWLALRRRSPGPAGGPAPPGDADRARESRAPEEGPPAGQDSAAGHADRVRRARRLGWRVLPGTAATITMLRADRLLLPWLGSYADLGRYVVVAALSELILVPVQAYVDAHVPRWRAAQLAGALRPLRVLALAAAYVVGCAALLTVAGRTLLVPVFGPAYAESVHLVAPLAAAAGLWALSRVATGLILATGRSRYVLLTEVPAMLVSIGCYLLLIPAHGAWGAALGSLAGYGLAGALGLALCLRATGRRGGTGRAAPGAGAA
ncbi:MAG TPA: polysaccharide biosynthesis C-terminal domain-containing protein [Pilimelia sp.]|nr:polysaccharide biosynthesis C-terminal domain-containing protein [Pilimelia sp.]